MAEEEVTPWNPWADGYSEIFETWLRASVLSGVIGERQFDYDDLITIIDNAERLELLRDMSREKAILLIGLWMGRYQGHQETGQWEPRIFVGETDIERAKEACQDFIDAIDDEDNRNFWQSLTRLLVALRSLHPENVI